MNTIIAQPLHTFKTGDTFVGATVDGDNLVIGETRNEEHASEGHFSNLLTVIPLADAIAMAKAILTQAQQAEEDAWIEEMYQRQLDHEALVDDAIEHDYNWIRHGC
ncbi:MAG: hypothetical protein IT328_23035 [Caldilineaceae bacterium]|nr:hypothetical protein [Caldilineaceae bacterium]